MPAPDMGVHTLDLDTPRGVDMLAPVGVCTLDLFQDWLRDLFVEAFIKSSNSSWYSFTVEYYKYGRNRLYH